MLVVAARSDASAPAAAASVIKGTPLWSTRRLPGPFVDPINAQRDVAAGVQMQSALDAELGRYSSACFIVGRGSTIVAERNADTPLIPASTQKLLTGAAALTTLGADFRFETAAVTNGTGASLDRVWLVGSGDPVIRTAEYMDEGVSTPLESLADAIVAQGVRRIGTIIGDDSRYDSQRYVPTWSPSYRTDLDVTPVGALTVTQGVAIVNGKPVVQDDPARFAAEELTRLLRARGVTVGDAGRGTAPAGATRVASVQSQPLRTIVGWILATSDNLGAEMVAKELGVRAGTGGTTTAGVAAVQDALRRLGVNLDGQVMVDGSGLDRGNRLTCRILSDVLELGARPDLRVLRDTLPGSPTATPDGRVYAKGGYLNNVTGFAGIVNRSPALRFAFLANGGVPGPSLAAQIGVNRFVDVLLAQAPPSPRDGRRRAVARHFGSLADGGGEREAGDPRAAAGLGRVHGAVGVGQQTVGIGVGVAERKAQARGHLDPGRIELERLVQGLTEAFGDGDRGAFVGNPFGDDHELIAAEASEGVVGTQDGLQPRGDELEQTIARGVAETVVHFLEVVEVEVEHGDIAAASTGASECVLQPVTQERAVGQPGEPIVEREVIDHALDVLAAGDVAGDRRHADEPAIGIDDWRHGY